MSDSIVAIVIWDCLLPAHDFAIEHCKTNDKRENIFCVINYRLQRITQHQYHTFSKK